MGGGGGGCVSGGGGSSEEDGGCLEGLRGRRGPRGRRGVGGKGVEATLCLQHDAIKFTAPQLARADAVLGDIIRDDLPMQGTLRGGGRGSNRRHGQL